MGTGLTFDQFVDLRLKPMAGADHVFHEAAELERRALFPMDLSSASNHLRQRGYDCKPAMLELLIENGVVTPAESGQWTQDDVDAAAEHFEACEIFVPYAAMCQALGCTYAGFLRPLREAAEHASQLYRRRVPEDDQYFVLHRVPPRGVTDVDGNLVEIKSAVISFTLCDDVRERLERGEEV